MLPVTPNSTRTPRKPRHLELHPRDRRPTLRATSHECTRQTPSPSTENRNQTWDNASAPLQHHLLCFHMITNAWSTERGSRGHPVGNRDRPLLIHFHSLTPSSSNTKRRRSYIIRRPCVMTGIASGHQISSSHDATHKSSGNQQRGGQADRNQRNHHAVELEIRTDKQAGGRSTRRGRHLQRKEHPDVAVRVERPPPLRRTVLGALDGACILSRRREGGEENQGNKCQRHPPSTSTMYTKKSHHERAPKAIPRGVHT